ncbi:MAG: glycoside hydrolase family 2 TIM barrel-domain containing protein [Bryobacteraceae bacterium]
MKDESGSKDSLSRRSLLGQAVGAAGILAALGSAGQADAQTQPAGDSGAARVRDSFDFGWKFFKGDAPGAQQPNFADASWRDVDLPHDWSIEGPFSEQPSPAFAFALLPTGIGWYRKRFSIPESYRDRKVVIEFDGVYQLSEVWINGQYLGKRPNGFIGFCYDLTPHLKFGGDNVIAVKADNSHQPNCRWYSGSGIYRHTWLLVTNKMHVAYWGTFVTTPEVAAESSIVEIKTKVQNEGGSDAECTLVTSILDRDGKLVQTGGTGTSIAMASQTIAAKGGEYEFVQQIPVLRPNLWSPDNPYLYKVRSTVKEGDRVVDEYDTVLGIRRIEFDVNKGFLLNGKQVKLNGVCLHHDGGSVGAAVPERVWERRLEKLKAMGCNSIRTTHNPYSPDFMDLCDRLGLMVMDEIFDEWKIAKHQMAGYIGVTYGYPIYFEEWSERDVTSFVDRDRNHASVVLWSAGNEIPDQVVPAGVETLRRLVEIFHREDPSRLVTAACERIARGRGVSTLQEFLELLDVVGYNYVERETGKYYSAERQAFPERRFIGTENPNMAIGAPARDEPERGGIDCTRPDIEQLWKFTKTYDYVCGDHMWTGIDYLGGSAWPAKAANCGEMDTCGFEKDGYYFYQSQWTGKPMVHVFPHWNWKGKEGEVIPVLCYTNCDSVELFLNGKSFGAKGYWSPRVGRGNPGGRSRAPETTLDLHLAWTVPYEPGTLKAVGTKDGKVVAEAEVTTAEEPAAIGLSVDRDAIVADRRDVAHVTVKILDAQGRAVPVADNEVAFEIQGEGKIIGLDNGDPVSHEDFKGKRRKVFQGRCLAIVQSTAKPGRIQLTATSPGLKSSSVAITTRA